MLARSPLATVFDLANSCSDINPCPLKQSQAVKPVLHLTISCGRHTSSLLAVPGCRRPGRTCPRRSLSWNDPYHTRLDVKMQSRTISGRSSEPIAGPLRPPRQESECPTASRGHEKCLSSPAVPNRLLETLDSTDSNRASARSATAASFQSRPAETVLTCGRLRITHLYNEHISPQTGPQFERACGSSNDSGQQTGLAERSGDPTTPIRGHSCTLAAIRICQQTTVATGVFRLTALSLRPATLSAHQTLATVAALESPPPSRYSCVPLTGRRNPEAPAIVSRSTSDRD